LKSRLFILIFTIIASLGFAQEDTNKVSLIGENEKEYEQMMTQCSTPLLYITNNSMDEAYNLWTNMLAKMEADASDQGIDIKGVKVWMNLFWEADGSIKKIVYYPKPNSKNMNFEQLTAFLQIFADKYVLDISHDTCFSHYGSATFPVFTKIAVQNGK
jgi:hypothetical protein